jgi:hypothetical protein
MNKHPNPLWRLAPLIACASALAIQADLVHRYSFNEASGTTVRDSVGTANGELKGTGGYFSGDGQLILPGGTGSAAEPELIAGYVDLPNHIINVLDKISIEAWVTWQGVGAWQRIFDFGTSAGGEEVSNGEGNYLFLSPAGDANLRFAVRDPATGAEPTQLTAGAPLESGSPVCVTVTYDPAANLARLYSNAVLLVTGPAPVALKDINDVNNWLGRSQWNDGMFEGYYDEFRIYNSVLDPVQVAASFVSGQAQPSTDPAKLGALQAVNLNVPKTTMVEQDTQTVWGTADYASFPGLRLAGVPGATIVSDNEAVLKVDATGLVTSVAPGTAKLTLSYQGTTDFETVTVTPRQTGVAVAGTLFVDLRAADVRNDPSSWPNRAGTGDFYAAGSPTYVANVEGTGIAGVRFNAEAPAADAYEGPLTTADLHGSSDCSIEVWAYNPAIADEETLVAWGRRGGPDGTNMSFNYGAHDTWGAVGHWGSPDMGWSGPAPAAGQWHYLVYTFDGVSTAKVYADGIVRTTEVMTLNTHPDLPIRIAAQANTAGTDYDFAQALSGYLAMVRVHTGKLTDTDVLNNYFYGPTLVPPGELQSVTLTVETNKMLEADLQTASGTANFANFPGLQLAGLPGASITSDNPAVLTVDAAGLVTAVKGGTATLTLAYQGKTDSETITVTGRDTGVAVAGTLFVDLRAEDVKNGTATWPNRAGTGNFTASGAPTYVADVAGTGIAGVQFNAATPATDAYEGPLTTADLHGRSDCSIEVWAYNPAIAAEETLVAWGRRGGPDGSNRSFNYGSNGTYGAVGHWGSPDMGWSGTPLAGQWHYLVYTYDGTSTAKVYADGALKTTKAVGALDVHADFPIRVAAQTLTDGTAPDFGQALSGYVAMVRVHTGKLTDGEVANNFKYGPTLTPPVETPALAIVQSGSNVILSWPASATGFVLESTASLGPPVSWGAVDVSGAVDQGGVKKLTLPIGSSNTYYRMRK